MCGTAVIALIVVVGGDLPVVRSLNLPSVVELIVVKVQSCVSFLFVDTLKEIIPCDFRNFIFVQVDPYQTVGVDVDVYWEGVGSDLIESGDISVTLDLTFSIAVQYEVDVCGVVFQPITSSSQSVSVCDEEPPSLEDSTSFELVHFWRSIPACW